MDSILGLTVLFGAGFAWILAFGLLFKRSTGPNHHVLFGMLLLLGVWQGQTGFSLLNINPNFLAPYSLFNLPAAYAFIPLFYAYGRKLSDSNFSVRNWIYLSFLLGIGIFLFEIYLLFSLSESQNWKEVALSTWSDPNRTGTPSFTLSALSYGPRILAILVSILLITISFNGKKHDSEWIRIRPTLVFLSLVGGVGAGLSLYAQATGRLKSDLHGWGAFFVTITICALYFFSQRFPILFELDFTIPGNRKSRLTRLNPFDLKNRLEIVIGSEKIYRVEDLSLNLFANAISQSGNRVTPEQVSEFINKNFGKNFNQFINEHRVKEACELLLKDRKASILDIALFVGFNSKSTFHSAFKTFTGMSPSEYRNKGFESDSKKI